LVHIGHLLKISETKASRFLVVLAIVTIAVAIVLALNYTSKHIPNVGYFIAGGFLLAFVIEIGLRLLTHRVITAQSSKGIVERVEEEIKELLGDKNGK